ncbi:CubicO group peptidase (beta-lactamase class C family) [Motilibacter rhizosphaerae]|uniref:CubicO group peptidase (Beta-lactamase class C family) n=1 Tax=Motilibacter rhizosphaerae TaxID=598652 RepID=A0A4Q7NQD4_9ACTN|nr:serine hydrolase domain-containing protein [Motilibacter rhizosphaerae]RZS86790.1 CubicO group peptidase (beta-lactamase class C family) [Motilibacter rhizosphaerae]
MPALPDVLAQVRDWPVPHVAVAVVGPDGILAAEGDLERAYALASVTKPLTAYATLLAVEEGALALDDPAGPAGSTVRHLLAHASGLPLEGPAPMAAPGVRRIYSNTGFEVLAAAVERAVEMPFADYLAEGVLRPLAMRASSLPGSAARAGVSTVRDLTAFAAELLRPALLHPTTAAELAAVQFPGLRGLVPGFGKQEPNDWGLGVEVRGTKAPHWTGPTQSPATFGHFGQSGTYVWVDRAAGVACVCLTDRTFEAWAAELWPGFNDAVLRAATGG